MADRFLRRIGGSEVRRGGETEGPRIAPRAAADGGGAEVFLVEKVVDVQLEARVAVEDLPRVPEERVVERVRGRPDVGRGRVGGGRIMPRFVTVTLASALPVSLRANRVIVFCPSRILARVRTILV